MMTVDPSRNHHFKQYPLDDGILMLFGTVDHHHHHCMQRHMPVTKLLCVLNHHSTIFFCCIGDTPVEYTDRVYHSLFFWSRTNTLPSKDGIYYSLLLP